MPYYRFFFFSTSNRFPNIYKVTIMKRGRNSINLVIVTRSSSVLWSTKMPPRLKKIPLLTSLFFAVFLAFNWIGSLTTTVNHGKITRHHVKRSTRSTSIDEIVKSNTIDETTIRPHYLRSKTAHKVIIPQQPCGYEVSLKFYFWKAFFLNWWVIFKNW